MDDMIKKTDLEGVLLISRPTLSDERGFFHEVFRKNELEEKIGSRFEIVQQNHSHSVKNTLRGIHTAPWSKLIYVPNGKVQEVVVDLREDSPTFKKWISVELGEDNQNAIFLPPNCGNGFLVLSEECDYTYSVSDYYTQGKEFGIIWNDPDINIEWKTQTPLLSDKDQKNPTIKEYFQIK
jgi:dTDP-4-dehydrorhamnose 3,5-epimerase